MGTGLRKSGHRSKKPSTSWEKKIKETAEKLFPAELLEKIAAMAKKYAKVIEEEVEEMVKKYEDLILDALTKDGKGIIAEAKKLLITTIDNIVERIVKIIHSVTVLEDTNEENGIKEMWELFKLIIKQEVAEIKEEMHKLVAKYEPRILEEKEKWNKELIHDLKSLAVDLLGDLIKIIIGIPDDEPLYDEPLMEVDSKVSDWFKKVWAQIKEAFDKLGEKIKETAEKLFPAELREKIAAMAKKYAKVIEEEVEQMVKKYEDLIL